MKVRFSNFRVLISILLWALFLTDSYASALITLLPPVSICRVAGTTVVNVTKVGLSRKIPAANVTVMVILQARHRNSDPLRRNHDSGKYSPSHLFDSEVHLCVEGYCLLGIALR